MIGSAIPGNGNFCNNVNIELGHDLPIAPDALSITSPTTS